MLLSRTGRPQVAVTPRAGIAMSALPSATSPWHLVPERNQLEPHFRAKDAARGCVRPSGFTRSEELLAGLAAASKLRERLESPDSNFFRVATMRGSVG